MRARVSVTANRAGRVPVRRDAGGAWSFIGRRVRGRDQIGMTRAWCEQMVSRLSMCSSVKALRG